MTNPWRDPEHGKTWRAEPSPGNPLRETQIDVVLSLLAVNPPRRVLDLGCGPGVVAARVLEHFEEARLWGLDVSSTMLARARENLATYGERAQLIEAAFEEDWPDDGHRFDVVLALQTVHHLSPADKQRLFRRVADRLEPGGMFILSDPVAIFRGPLFAHHIALWNRARRLAGFDALPADYDAVAHHEHLASQGDLPDPIESQLGWLCEAGFDPVDTFWRHGHRAIFGGLRAPQ